MGSVNPMSSLCPLQSYLNPTDMTMTGRYGSTQSQRDAVMESFLSPNAIDYSRSSLLVATRVTSQLVFMLLFQKHPFPMVQNDEWDPSYSGWLFLGLEARLWKYLSKSCLLGWFRAGCPSTCLSHDPQRGNLPCGFTSVVTLLWNFGKVPQVPKAPESPAMKYRGKTCCLSLT